MTEGMERNHSQILNSLEKVIGNDYSQSENQTEPNDVNKKNPNHFSTQSVLKGVTHLKKKN